MPNERVCIKWIRWRSRHSIMHKSLRWPWWTRDAWHLKTFASGFRSILPIFVAIKIGMWVLRLQIPIFSWVLIRFLYMWMHRIPFGTIYRCIFASRKLLAIKLRKAKVATGSCRWIQPKAKRNVFAIDENNATTQDASPIVIGIYAIISSTARVAK